MQSGFWSARLTQQLWTGPSACACLEELVEKALCLLLHGEDVGADLVERAQGLWLVEVACEADLVADLGDVGLDPGIVGVGQHFAVNEGLDPARLEERNLLGVAQVGVGLVLDDGWAARRSARSLEEAVDEIRPGLAGLVHLGDDGRSLLLAPAHRLEDLLEIGCDAVDGTRSTGSNPAF